MCQLIDLFNRPLAPPAPPPSEVDRLRAEAEFKALSQAPAPQPPNTDPESLARWAEFDKIMADPLAREKFANPTGAPPTLQPIQGPESAMLDRYFKVHPHTAYSGGQFLRCESGLWRPLPPEQFRHEVDALVDDARARGNLPSHIPLHRLPRLIAERLRRRLAVESEFGPPPPNTLPLANGLLDLATGELRPIQPADYLTAALPYAFDPAARSQLWADFLQSRVPEAAEFLQEFAGLSLTPDTRYETALWLYGRPGTGKSTFLRGLQVLLGPRAGVLNPSYLLTGRFSPDAVEGKTLLVCAEPAQLNLANADRFSAFVSGEPLTAEPKYRRAETIQPRAKLAWAFTTLPFVPDADSPLFRRVLIVPFPDLLNEKRDPSLKPRLDADGPGLLNWALAGLRRLIARGRFDPPPVVLAATEQFQQTNDLPALFLADRCELDAEQKVQASRLHKAFEAWCRTNGHTAPSSTLLARDWVRLGLQRRRSNTGSYWFGLRLRGM